MNEDPASVENEHLFKILVVGNLGVGKTSLIRRYVYEMFSTRYKATIGVDFCLKTLTLNQGKTVARLQIWDIAGQERFGSMTRTYYRGAHGAIIVCDSSDQQSFYDVEQWQKDILGKMEKPIPILMLINKCDLPSKLAQSSLEIQQFADDKDFVDCARVSAMSGQKVSESIEKLVLAILESGDIALETDEDVIDLNSLNSSFIKNLPCCNN